MHAIKRNEFPGFSKPQFEQHIRKIINNPTKIKQLSRGRNAYWDQKSGTVVIKDPLGKDGGTAFKPIQGKLYFEEVLR